MEIQDLATFGHAARIVAAYIDLNPVRAGMAEDPKDYEWSGYGRAVRGEKSCVRGVVRLWGKQRGVKGAMEEYRVFLFEEGSEERLEDRSSPLTPALCPQAGVCRLRLGTPKGRGGPIGGAGTAHAGGLGTGKGRTSIDARKVWEERKRGGRLPLRVMLRLKSRYLVDGAAIGSAEFLRRLTGKSEGMAGDATLESDPTGTPENPVEANGRDGVAMRFGQWGGLRVLRDLRVGVVG